MNWPESSNITPPKGVRLPPAGKLPTNKGPSPFVPYTLGILTGVLFMLVVGLALFGLGFLGQAGGACPAPGTCPPTVALLPICPTCGPLPTYTLPAETPIPPTATFDAIGATATAACSEFSLLFPGTPCPP